MDAGSYNGQLSNLEIRGYRLSVPDTTSSYNSYINIPVRVSSLTGLGVLSGTFNMSYNQAALSDIQIVTANSILASLSPPTINLNTPGVIQLSFASTIALSGSGVLFYIRCKLSNHLGSYSSLYFQTALLNENQIGRAHV